MVINIKKQRNRTGTNISDNDKRWRNGWVTSILQFPLPQALKEILQNVEILFVGGKGKNGDEESPRGWLQDRRLVDQRNSKKESPADNLMFSIQAMLQFIAIRTLD